MLSFLKNHPFAVDAFFSGSVVLTFAFPKETLQPLIPPCLTLDTFEEETAFAAVALVETKDLRPRGFPKFLGQDFFLLGYRVYVIYRSNSGKRLRGLFILGSATDSKKMQLLGNIFTKYKYRTIDIQKSIAPAGFSYRSTKAAFDFSIDAANPLPDLPETSVFRDWGQARRFAGPLPFTFSYDAYKRETLIVQGVRESWQPRPVIAAGRFPLIPGLQSAAKPRLANAFIVENIPYSWKKGKIEKWQKS